MKIKDLPESSQPRERFLKYGSDVLSDAELLAIILRTGLVGENVIEMSNRLISKFGLVNLFDCSLKELQGIKGIGQNKAMQILAIAKIGERYAQEKNSIKKINSAEDVFKFFHSRLKHKKQEHFYILMLDNMNNVIEEKLVSIGILDKTLIHPREIFRDVLKNTTSKIILVHNHPDGDPTPSSNDLEITEELVKVGNLIGIKILDHVIIGKEEKWSWKEDS